MQNLQETRTVYQTSFSFEQLLVQALRLPPLQKVQLVEKLMGVLEQELAIDTAEQQPRRSLYGVLAHLGSAPSTEEIDQVRAEVWANFPREDV